MKKFEIIPHTADVGIRVYGKSLPELFQNALLGMSEILKKGIAASSQKPSLEIPIEVSSIDSNTLLVDFLSEVLALADINQAVYPKIKFDKFSEKELSGRLFGYSVEEFDEDIKAVTYHAVDIKKIKNHYEVAVIFDI